MKYEVIENEKWIVIPGHPTYEVSNLGRVRHLKKSGLILIKPWKNGVGYYYVNLTKGASKLIHRLVADAFIPNVNNLSEINHINENKADNRAENLEWCTHKDNCRWGTRNAKISKSQKENWRIKREGLPGDM